MVRDVLLVFIVSAPAGQVVDHVKDPTVVTDNVKVPLQKSKFLEYDSLRTTYVVDKGPVVLETEYDVIPPIIHEVVDHGEVNIARVGELLVTNMEGQSGVEIFLEH